MESDFSIYDDLDYPYLFGCSRFTYRNKAQIKKDEQIAVAMVAYRKRSRNLTVRIYHSFVLDFTILRFT
jgi:hypothetical protein